MAELESAEHTGLLSEGREISLTAAGFPKQRSETLGSDTFSTENGANAAMDRVRERVAIVMEHETNILERLMSAQELTKRTQAELKEARSERLALETKLRSIDHKAHLMKPKVGPLDWVDSNWFGFLSSTVVVLNLGWMIEVYYQAMGSDSATMKLCDNIFLLWYCFELIIKFAHHGMDLFFHGMPASLWNWLDLGIVASGVLDQFVSPAIYGHRSGTNFAAIKFLRMFRFLRFLKLLKTFLVTDLDWLLEHAYFDIFMATVIGLNALLISFQLDYEWCGWAWVDNILLVIYLFELLLRLKRWGKHYFVHHLDWMWNWLDFTIVTTGMLDMWLLPVIILVRSQIFNVDTSIDTAIPDNVMSLVKLMRLMRVLRLVRVLRSIPQLYTLLMGVIGAFQAMKWVIVLTLLTLYAGAIVFTNLIGKGLIYPDQNVPEDALKVFGSMSASLFSLFELMNGDTEVIRPITSLLVGKFLFAGFMVIANWAVLAILTAVVSENMITTSGRIAEEEKDKIKQEAYRKSEERLLEVFERNDPGKSGRISNATWKEMIHDGPTRIELTEGTHLTKDDLVDLFDCLAIDDDDVDDEYVDYRDLIKSLKANTTMADKRSVLHVMIRLRAMQEQIQQQRDAQHEHVNERFDELKKLINKSHLNNSS